MFRLVVITCCLIAASSSQRVDPRDAKILQEQRFETGDGRAGSAFATENDIVFKEETDRDGNRVGQYSYVGENGQVYSVKYSAGVDGFRILEGSHVRATGQEAAPFSAEESLVQRPLPQPTRIPAPVVDNRQATGISSLGNTPVPAQIPGSANPFVNPHDPTHRNFQFNANGANFGPKVPGAGVFDSSFVPNCAGCENINPFINPFDASHQPQALAGTGQQVQSAPPNAQPTGRVFRAQQTTTQRPSRFFPPGQLKVNRFDTGFNFDFQS